jgi:hypothetical protein
VFIMALGCENVQLSGPKARQFGEAKLAVELADKAISESSGLARSHADPGWYYTHNDSGDAPRFWKFNLEGRTLGPYTVSGAKAVDWEDMASAQVGGKNYLYFADIGDNAARRESVQIYRMEEPAGGPGPDIRAEKFELKYPDGPHNAEAFMVVPETGAFLIVTKTAKSPAGIYALTEASTPGSYVLEKLGEVSIGSAIEPSKLVTGGDISPDGKWLVIRSYLAAFEFPVGKEEWWRAKPQTILTVPELQGEAIAYSHDGKDLITTSEIAPCRVSVIAVATR